jgi:HNH endonuclease
MSQAAPTLDEIVAAIKDVAAVLGHSPSRSEFISRSGITEYHILSHFESWNAAVRAAGQDPDETNLRADDQELLIDWAALVRKHRRIPTRHQYRREGSFSPGVFDRHFGAWSGLPAVFRAFAEGRPEE